MKPLLDFIQGGSSLHYKLLHSHLQIALISVLMLGVTLVAIISLRDAAQRAVSEQAPTMQATASTLSGLRHSQAEARGWIALGEQRFREGRRTTWEQEIWPAMDQMQSLSRNWLDPHDLQRLTQLSRLFTALEEIQWWIEDVAQTPGNEPAQMVLVQDIEPIDNEVLSIINTIIDEQMGNELGAEHKHLLSLMVAFRAAFLHSTMMLGDFVNVGDAVYQQAYAASVASATEHLHSIATRQPLLSVQQQQLLLWLQQNFNDYRYFAEQALVQRQSKEWNIAHHLLVSQAVPLAQQATELLQAMTASQQLLMTEEATEVAMLGSIAVWLSLALISTMMIMAGVLSRRSAMQIARPVAALSQATQALAEGRLTQDIPITSSDELGQLTDAFNRMRRSLQQGEAALQHKAQHLERSNRDLDQFAYVASHDLKAPLRAIANLSCWIEEDIDTALTPETRQQMALLRGRVHRMEGLLEAILLYSQVGRVNVMVELVDVSVLLDEVVKKVAPPAEFTLEIGDGMPAFKAPRQWLTLLFTHLIDNAIKFHDRPDGHIAITVNEVDDYYQFAVSDDGPGIATAYHDKIFTIFQTLQARDQFESTGVGLTLVKKIVEEHGGKVTVASTEGRGACFSFTWPKQLDDLQGGENSAGIVDVDREMAV